VTAPRERGPRRLRLFFALWPNAGLRERLAASARAAFIGVDGQPVPPGNLHVTLAFLGLVLGTRLAELIAVGGNSPWPAVALRFERAEYWARPKVLVAIPAAVPETGRRIVERLWDRVEPLGFKREERPWQPHLTLMRRVRRPPADEIGFTPAVIAGGRDWRLALVESTTHPEGPRYKPLAEWKFAARGVRPLHEDEGA
jgi:RNA 2',3'-cyclic 3'-phosphodiesterase